MVRRAIYDVQGNYFSCLYVPEPVPVAQIREAMEEADYLAVNWQDRTSEVSLTFLEKELGDKLLVPEVWQNVLPRAGILISSSISGGDLRQRFGQAAKAAPGHCWLQLERLSMVFPLPCPDGQGVPTEPPQQEGFFSESLGCRYIHRPSEVILFDTDETLEQKCHWALEAGFVGWIAP